MKYRKRSVVVEAEQWFPDIQVEGVIFPVAPAEGGIRFHGLNGPDSGLMETACGWQVVLPGSWVVTDDSGERHCYREDVFEAAYEAVGDEAGDALSELSSTS